MSDCEVTRSDVSFKSHVYSIVHFVVTVNLRLKDTVMLIQQVGAGSLFRGDKMEVLTLTKIG